jgi:hypothetical protein
MQVTEFCVGKRKRHVTLNWNIDNCWVLSRSRNSLGLAVDPRTGLCNLPISHNVKWVQYVEQQDDQVCLSPVSSEAFSFGYRCFRLYRKFSRSLTHSLWNKRVLFHLTHVGNLYKNKAISVTPAGELWDSIWALCLTRPVEQLQLKFTYVWLTHTCAKFNSKLKSILCTGTFVGCIIEESPTLVLFGNEAWPHLSG